MTEHTNEPCPHCGAPAIPIPWPNGGDWKCGSTRHRIDAPARRSWACEAIEQAEAERAEDVGVIRLLRRQRDEAEAERDRYRTALERIAKWEDGNEWRIATDALGGGTDD